MTSSAASKWTPFLVLLASLLLLAVNVPPAISQAGSNPIDFDLRNWNAYGPGGTWTVAPDGSQVVQEENGEPFFFVSPESVINSTIRGNFEVETTSDDDLVGFVFGYDSPTDTDPDNYEFTVLSWKQFDQSGFGGCVSPAGFTLTQISGVVPQDIGERGEFVLDTLWCHEQINDDPRAEVLATAWDPDGGWADNTEYQFELTYTSSNFRLVLDGQTVMDVDGTFSEGSFGFYNYSQPNARYSGFTQEDIPEPGPGQDEVDPDDPGTNRLPGEDAGDAVDVADQICNYLVSDGRANQIALARNDDFADALAGSQLPFIECILYTTGGPSATLDDRTRGEIDRALVPGGVVYILGGTNAVSVDVENELVGAGYEVRRLSGPTRFETAEGHRTGDHLRSRSERTTTPRRRRGLRAQLARRHHRWRLGERPRRRAAGPVRHDVATPRGRPHHLTVQSRPDHPGRRYRCDRDGGREFRAEPATCRGCEPDGHRGRGGRHPVARDPGQR